MIFKKNVYKNVLSEGSICRQNRDDFKRRSDEIYENYRAVEYKKPDFYDIEKIKEENGEILKKLVMASAVDAGNEDCLVEKILGPIRKALQYLEAQSVTHRDSYYRYGVRRKTDYHDLKQADAEWALKEEQLKEEHEITKQMWEKYSGYTL